MVFHGPNRHDTHVPMLVAETEIASAGELNWFKATVSLGVSEFLDVESTVRLSQTCRVLHTTFTHDPNGLYPKIKVSHLSIEDASIVRDKDGNRLRPGGPRGKMTSISHKVLPKIYFPSLITFQFRGSGSGNMVLANGPDDMKDLFVTLAVGLETATNLELFHFDIGLIIKFDRFNMKVIYETFGRNLAKCTQLKSLKIFNHYTVHSRQIQMQTTTYYSQGFLLALLPTIINNVQTVGPALEEFTLIIGNRPAISTSDRVYSNAARNVFAAALRMRKLKEFDLQFDLASSPLLNEFLQVCEHLFGMLGTLPSVSLERFTLTSVLYKPGGIPNRLPPPLSLAPCLALLGRSVNLHTFVVRIPSGCWDSKSISKLKGVLSSKPMLRNLGLYFNGYECNDGRSLEYILDYIQERELCSDNVVHVSGLACKKTSFDKEEALGRYHSRKGEKCLRLDARGLIFQAEGYMMGW